MAADGLAPKTVRIRMYHVGFGDCFLLSFNAGDGARHILIDCGVHARGQIPELPMSKIVDAIGAETGKILDLVIATHRHQDHIAGFGEPAFGSFKVGAVWMPWTEDPNDQQANKLRKTHLALVKALAGGHLVIDTAKNALANLDLTGNDAALKMLTSGFEEHPNVQYLRAGDKPNLGSDLKGLQVQVLGPPDDPTFLAKMDPPAGHHYLGQSSSDVDKSLKLEPVRESWKLRHPSQELKELAKEIDQALLGSEDELALALDNVVNNTSLVLLFTIGDKQFLFPGDAQWGNWKSWLDKFGADALKSICFYKVSHHGSLNATPTDAVKAMPQGNFAAMASTQNTPFPSVPKAALMKALDYRTNGFLVESDGTKNVLAALKKPFKPQNAGDFWIDYETEFSASK